MPQKHQIIWLIHLFSYPYHRQRCPYSFTGIIPREPYIMSQLIDETPYMRMSACNGRSFVFPEIATIHDMLQQHLATFSAVLNVLSLKDIPNNPFHCLFKPFHSQSLNQIVMVKVKVKVIVNVKVKVAKQEVIIHHLPQSKPFAQIVPESMGKKEHPIKLRIRNTEPIVRKLKPALVVIHKPFAKPPVCKRIAEIRRLIMQLHISSHPFHTHMMLRPCSIRLNSPCKSYDLFSVLLQRQPFFPQPHVNIPTLPIKVKAKVNVKVIKLRHSLPFQNDTSESFSANSLIHLSTLPIHHLIPLLYLGSHGKPPHIHRQRNRICHFLYRFKANA